jgi:hypothetical protein
LGGDFLGGKGDGTVRKNKNNDEEKMRDGIFYFHGMLVAGVKIGLLQYCNKHSLVGDEYHKEDVKRV